MSVTSSGKAFHKVNLGAFTKLCMTSVLISVTLLEPVVRDKGQKTVTSNNDLETNINPFIPE